MNGEQDKRPARLNKDGTPARTGSGYGKGGFGKPAGKTYGKPSGSKPTGRSGGTGEKRSYGRPADGERKSYGRPADGERKPYARPVDGERKPYGRPADGERKSYGRPADGERKPYARPVDGERKPYARPVDGERKSYGRPADGERKPYTRSADGERKPYGRPAGGERRSYGKPAYGRPAVREKTKKKPEEVQGLPARRLALKVIREVTEEGAYAALSLDKALRGCGLIAADRRLVSRLVYDTLDRLIYLDHAIAQVMAKEDTDIKLRNILRLGACQILLEDRIPESAATNTCVALCVELGMEGLKGVCNGILRNLVRKKDELLWPDSETEPVKAFSVRTGVPEWLAERLIREYGPVEAEQIAVCRADERPITLRMNPLKMTESEFAAMLDKKIWGREKGSLPGTWQITGAMDIGSDSDYLEGNFSIQSESSVMACMAAGIRPGMKVLDCCAAPGGKTGCIAEMLGGTGRVQAWDIHSHRVELIEAQVRRLGLENVRPIVRDATKRREDLIRSMDVVLLDAPCSGLGVMAEKPDLKLRVTEEGVGELTALQRNLLETVCEYVRPGGTLVYSTCSVLKEENREQAEAFLERHPEFEPIGLPATIPDKWRQYEDLGLQLLEYRDGVEGFYICPMRRKDER